MASRKFFNSRPNHVHPSSDNPISSSDSQFEFEESEVWDNNNNNNSRFVGPTPTESNKKAPDKYARSSSTRKVPATGKKADRDAPAAGSLPVTIPDWSKILKDEYRDNRFRDGDVDDSGVNVDDRVPPHEYLARRRGASMSVHEGFGRTLKGSDLRRVRNAIWKKVGFED